MAAVCWLTSRWGLAEPGDGEGVSELVKVDGVPPEIPADEQAPAWYVEVAQEEPGNLALAEPMDGDQGDDELGHRAVGPVDQAAEPTGGDRDGKTYDCRHRDPAGGVTEDEPFLLERLEQAAEGAGQIQAGLPRPPFENLADVLCGDLPKARDPAGPQDQYGAEVAEVFPDRLEGHRAMRAAAFTPQDQDPAAQLAGDPGGKFLETLVDGLLVDAGLACGVGDDQFVVLQYCRDPGYRRTIRHLLNRGETRNGLARDVFHGHRGQLRKHYQAGQETQLDTLGIMINIIVLWQTVYTQAALGHLDAHGHHPDPADVVRLTPLGHPTINLHGRYQTTSRPPASGLRPLRTEP